MSRRGLFWSVRFLFLDFFGERCINRTIPAHGDWTETPGWNFRGRFYPCDMTTKPASAWEG
jgi:hypothetical protein